MLVYCIGGLGNPHKTWNGVRFWLFLSLLSFPPGLASLFGEAYRDALFEKSLYVTVSVTTVYSLLAVVIVDLFTPEHVKSKICHFSLRKFLQEHPVEYPTVFPAIYSTIYPVVYVGIATCVAVFSSFFMKWFFISGLLFSHRIRLVKLNGVSKLNFIYTMALIVFPLKGSWSALVSTHHVFTEKWSISTSGKVFGVLAAIRLLVEVLFTFYCVKEQIVPDAVTTGDGLEKEKETETETTKENINDKMIDNIGILTMFSVTLLPTCFL